MDAITFYECVSDVCMFKQRGCVGWGFKVAPYCYHRNVALWSLLAPFFCSWICSASGLLLSHHPLRSPSAASKISLFEDLSRLQVKRRAISGSIQDMRLRLCAGLCLTSPCRKDGGKSAAENLKKWLCSHNKWRVYDHKGNSCSWGICSHANNMHASTDTDLQKRFLKEWGVEELMKGWESRGVKESMKRGWEKEKGVNVYYSS